MFDCSVDALDCRKGGLRVFTFKSQVDGDRLPIEVGARSPSEFEHDQAPFEG